MSSKIEEKSRGQNSAYLAFSHCWHAAPIARRNSAGGAEPVGPPAELDSHSVPGFCGFAPVMTSGDCAGTDALARA